MTDALIFPAASQATAQKAKHAKHQRADTSLVSQGLASNRSLAKALILAGYVYGKGDRQILKAGELLASDELLRLKQELPYVSRGGLKLEAAIQHWAINVENSLCVDIGASTGGFTDCLLQHGAQKIYAIDVGYGQLAWKLRQDPRVIVMERCNIRRAPADLLPEKVQYAVMDLSFISLTMVLSAVLPLLEDEGHLIALIKPQFEVGREHIGKKGVVRDAIARQAAVEKIISHCQQCHLKVDEPILSPIVGAQGNIEYLMHAQKIAAATNHPTAVLSSSNHAPLLSSLPNHL